MKPRNILLLTAVAGFLMFGCSKSKDDSSVNSTPAPVNIWMLSVTAYTNGQVAQSFYYYNANRAISEVKSLRTPSDTVLDFSYHYQDNVLLYSVNHEYTIPDTIFYSFDGNQRLMNNTEHFRAYSLLFITRTDYIYNAENKVICSMIHRTLDTLTTFSHSHGPASVLTTDSIIFIYTGNNVTSYVDYMNSTGQWRPGLLLDYTYDTQKNYAATMHMPSVYFLYWSANNVIGQTSPGSQGNAYTLSYKGYTSAGYPSGYVTSISTESAADSVFFSYQSK